MIGKTNHGRLSSQPQYHPEQNSSESQAVKEKKGTECLDRRAKCSKYYQKEAQVVLLQDVESPFADRENETDPTQKCEKPEAPIRSWSSPNDPFF